MVQANHHSKSECLASDQPFENGTILNQNFKTFRIGMAFGFRAPTVFPLLFSSFADILMVKHN